MRGKLFLAIFFFAFFLNREIFAQTSGWQWRNLTPTTAAPEARRNGAAIYDPQARRVILFGGTGNSGVLNDLWAFDVTTRAWTQLTPQGAPPPPRLGFDAIYDAAGHQMVIWAGQGAGFFNDTWTLNLTTLEWRNVSPIATTDRPKARYGSGSVYDPTTRSLVQFAGFTEESRRFQDTQAFNLATNTWQDITPSSSKPEIRCLLTAALDRTRRRMIMYGGQRNGPLDDLWAFDLATRNWTNLTPIQRPAGRFFTTSFVDRDGRFTVFGGNTSQGVVNELWAFDLTINQWNQLTVPNPPAPRYGAMGAYIEGEDRLILFGGQGNNLFNDVWELRNTRVANVSGASYAGASLARDSIASAFGIGLATATQSAASLSLPTQLAGTTVRVRDSNGIERLAQLFYVSSPQVNYQVPPGTAPGTATVTITSADGAISVGSIQVTATSPGLFSADATGTGYAAAQIFRRRADGSESYEAVAQYDPAQQKFVAVPIEFGTATDQVFLLLYGTGIRNHDGLATITASIGGTSALVEYAGDQNFFVGLDQVNVRLPRNLSGRGETEIQLSVGGKIANTIKVNFK